MADLLDKAILIGMGLERKAREVLDELEKSGKANKETSDEAGLPLKEKVENKVVDEGIKALKEISGVGEGLAKKVIQCIETGKINEYERLKKSIPKGLDSLMDIEGLGPKKIAFLYKKLKIKKNAWLLR